MFQSRISVKYARAKDTQTDKLYDPLRKTFLQDTTAKKTALQSATKVSNISHKSHTRNIIQSHQIAQKTLIPEDAKLIRCYDLQKIPKNKKYCVVNAEQKQLAPISPLQLQKRMKSKNQQVIVYTYGQKNVTYEPEHIVKLQPQIKTKLSSSSSRSYNFKRNKVKQIGKKQPKYNLFSSIDEGTNNMLKGGSCVCPANQIIAQQSKQVKWQLRVKR